MQFSPSNAANMLVRSLWGFALSASVAVAGLTNTLNLKTSTAIQCTTKKTSVSVKNVPTSTKTVQPPPQVVLVCTQIDDHLLPKTIECS